MTAFERPLFGGVAYAHRVMRSEREKFEQQQGWEIKTMKRQPSAEQDEYAPVIFAQETLSYLKNLDMMSGEVTLLTPSSWRPNRCVEMGAVGKIILAPLNAGGSREHPAG